MKTSKLNNKSPKALKSSNVTALMVIKNNNTAEADAKNNSKKEGDTPMQQCTDNQVHDAVIIETAQTKDESTEKMEIVKIYNIPLELIEPSPMNDRTDWNEKELQELSQSIKDVGVQSPILVRPIPGNKGLHQIIFGERRYRASKMAEKQAIPCLVQDCDDDEALKLTIIENLHRKELSDFEQGKVFLRYIQNQYTVEQIALTLGVSEFFIQTRLRLLALIPEFIQQYEDGKLTIAKAIELAKYDEKIQKDAYQNHFNNWMGGWGNLTAKQLAKELNEKYGKELDRYSFDKTECKTCADNTGVAVLFSECSLNPSCKNWDCLRAKNNSHIIASVDEQLKKYPLTVIVLTSPNEVVREYLEENGIQIKEDFIWQNYLRISQPERPVKNKYPKLKNFKQATADYEAELKTNLAEIEKQERQVAQGRKTRYCVINYYGVEIYYDKEVKENTKKSAKSKSVADEIIQDNKNLKEEIIVQESKDKRNFEICQRNIVKDSIKMLGEKLFSSGNLTKEERVMEYFYKLKSLRIVSYEIFPELKDGYQKHHGSYKGIGGYFPTYRPADELLMQISRNLSPEQKNIIDRDWIFAHLKQTRERELVPSEMLCIFGLKQDPIEQRKLMAAPTDLYNKRKGKIEQKVTALLSNFINPEDLLNPVPSWGADDDYEPNLPVEIEEYDPDNNNVIYIPDEQLYPDDEQFMFQAPAVSFQVSA